MSYECPRNSLKVSVRNHLRLLLLLGRCHTMAHTRAQLRNCEPREKLSGARFKLLLPHLFNQPWLTCGGWGGVEYCRYDASTSELTNRQNGNIWVGSKYFGEQPLMGSDLVAFNVMVRLYTNATRSTHGLRFIWIHPTQETPPTSRWLHESSIPLVY